MWRSRNVTQVLSNPSNFSCVIGTKLCGCESFLLNRGIMTHTLCPSWIKGALKSTFYSCLALRSCYNKSANNLLQVQKKNHMDVLLTDCMWVDVMRRSTAVDCFSLLSSKTCTWAGLLLSTTIFFTSSNSHLLSLFAPLGISQRWKCAFGNEMKPHVLSAWWDVMEFTAELWNFLSPLFIFRLFYFFFLREFFQVLFFFLVKFVMQRRSFWTNCSLNLFLFQFGLLSSPSCNTDSDYLVVNCSHSVFVSLVPQTSELHNKMKAVCDHYF